MHTPHTTHMHIYTGTYAYAHHTDVEKDHEKRAYIPWPHLRIRNKVPLTHPPLTQSSLTHSPSYPHTHTLHTHTHPSHSLSPGVTETRVCFTILRPTQDHPERRRRGERQEKRKRYAHMSSSGHSTHSHTHILTLTQSLKAVVGELWIEYFFEDPVTRDKERWAHLRRGQRRREQ